jgi:membrane protease YdiL (CAAX protease family)
MKETTETRDNPLPLATLSPLTVTVVLLPILLMKLFVFFFTGQRMSAVTAEYTLFPFLVYVGFNILVIAAGWILLHNRLRWQDIGFTRFRWSDAGLGTVAALIGIFIIYPVSVLLADILGLEGIKGMNYSLNDPLNIVSAVVIASLIGPLAEDILFRGFLLTLLGSKLRQKWLVGLLGVLIFSSIHIFYFGWGGVLFILLWSPLSVILFLWRKSIYPCLVLHVLNNMTAYVLIPVILNR